MDAKRYRFTNEQTAALFDMRDELGMNDVGEVISRALALCRVGVDAERDGSRIGFYDAETGRVVKVVKGLTQRYER